MLPEIVEVIKYKIPVFLEGGIRKGTDIFKALALGATAVFIDKPLQWGYAHDVRNIVCNRYKNMVFSLLNVFAFKLLLNHAST